MSDISYLMNANPAYIEELYKKYKQNPAEVDEQWQKFFQGFELGLEEAGPYVPAGGDVSHIEKEIKVMHLIEDYRRRGHLFTRTNPVRQRRKYFPTLDLENYGLSEEDLDTIFQAGNEIGLGPATLREIVNHLNETYCRSVGAEYMFIRIPWRVKWLQKKMESTRNLPNLTPEDKKHILRKLNEAVVFENFLHTNYLGQKRFALSGGETLIPGLEFLIEKATQLSVEDVVIGMAHRGRLNVLANILHKTYNEIFKEFEPIVSENNIFAGDVKYHVGFTSRIKTRQRKEVQVSIAHNPSHLEAVTPVVTGIARARIDKFYNHDASKVLPVIIHGDAAIAGQGVVYEVVQMAQLNGYHVGGTIHIVINNQLGFTTNYLEGRSSTYCTDVGKVTLSPVFHVNADDAEAVVYVMQLAMEYRQTFQSDVFIDLLGYRRYGHNESDEPRYTQPKLYKAIAKHPDPRKIYYEKLLNSNSVERGIAEEMEKEFKNLLQEKLKLVKSVKEPFKAKLEEDVEKEYHRDPSFSFEDYPATGVKKKTLKDLARKIFQIPENYSIFPKIRRLYDDRKKRVLEEKPLDWGTTELLTYATLVTEGIPVRISGQDSKRGTFSHRHAVIFNEETEDEFVPINSIDKKQAPFYIYNSPLSEYGVLGFEYGYAYGRPEALTIWEAQFGDFANGAQIIIDEFITSAESKWNKLNGIVLYLPHGYEGQGADHSSARMERFMSLCANNNLHVANPTTPANLFHLLRLHMHMPFRLPLIIFTPKSLLRHPRCISQLDELENGRFQPVYDDSQVVPEKVDHIILCSGKIYYELTEYREKQDIQNVAVIRLEQLYPFPVKTMQRILQRYGKIKTIRWVQEEPENMGYWPYLEQHQLIPGISVVARPANSAPATGFFRQHQLEQEQIILEAFSVVKTKKTGRKKAAIRSN
jgi:2-oxoglutarate dehydrogenase E1 component